MTPAAAAAKAGAGGWLVSPAFDLLFFANAGWLLLLVPDVATRHDTALDFWQLYYPPCRTAGSRSSSC